MIIDSAVERCLGKGAPRACLFLWFKSVHVTNQVSGRSRRPKHFTATPLSILPRAGGRGMRMDAYQFASPPISSYLIRVI